MGEFTQRGWYARWVSDDRLVDISLENVGMVTLSVHIGRTYIPEDFTPAEARAAATVLAEAAADRRPVTVQTRHGASTAGADLDHAETLEAADAFNRLAGLIEKEGPPA